MSEVDQIEKAVRDLSEPELARFRAWFEEFDRQSWDAKIEADVASGHLDRIADEALGELDGGRTRPL